MVVATLSAERRVALHHRALWLEYVSVPVADQDRALAFYTDALGC
jgi:hypothetical protein